MDTPALLSKLYPETFLGAFLESKVRNQVQIPFCRSRTVGVIHCC